MSKPWNDWYHVTVHTYGSWLRGDARGWRARDHREHVDGDYKRPPAPGTYAQLYERSKSLMTRPQVWIPNQLRDPVLTAFVRTLREHGTEVLIASLDGTHGHLLGRFRKHNPRENVRWAKMRASQAVKCHPLYSGMKIPEGKGLWALRSHATPVIDRAHQLKIFKYIHAHANRDAVLWDFRVHQTIERPNE